MAKKSKKPTLNDKLKMAATPKIRNTGVEVKDVDIKLNDSLAQGGFRSLDCNNENIGLAQVLEPTTDLQIANKKYVDDNSGGGTGDVIGPSTSTDSTIAVFDGVSGKVIKEATGPISANNQQIKNGVPGVDPTDFATGSQLGGGSLVKISADYFDSTTNAYIRKRPLGQYVPLNLVTVLFNDAPTFPYTAISSYNVGLQSLVEIADVSPFRVGSVLFINDGSYYAGVYLMGEIIETGTTGIVIDRQFNATQSGNISVQSTFSWDLDIVNNCSIQTGILLLDSPQSYSSATNLTPGITSLDLDDPVQLPSTNYFVVNSVSGAYTGMFPNTGTSGNSIVVRRGFSGTDTGTIQTAQFYPFIVPSIGGLFSVNSSASVQPDADSSINWAILLDTGSGFNIVPKSQFTTSMYANNATRISSQEPI